MTDHNLKKVLKGQDETECDLQNSRSSLERLASEHFMRFFNLERAEYFRHNNRAQANLESVQFNRQRLHEIKHYLHRSREEANLQ